jgi:hypothetical protein
VTRTLGFAAAKAASRGGEQGTSKALMGRWKHEIQIAIMRRRAAMVRAVLPRVPERLAWLLTGRNEVTPNSAGREPLLEEDEGEGVETVKEQEEDATQEGGDDET